MQLEKLINWRQLSKAVSNSGSETSIRKNDCPIKYELQVVALLELLKSWEGEYIKGIKPSIKYSKEEIKDKLNTLQW